MGLRMTALAIAIRCHTETVLNKQGVEFAPIRTPSLLCKMLLAMRAEAYLSLPAGQEGSSRAYHGLVAIGQRGDEVVRVAEHGGLDDVIHGHLPRRPLRVSLALRNVSVALHQLQTERNILCDTARKCHRMVNNEL